MRRTDADGWRSRPSRWPTESGFAYPIANMPKIIQYLTIINPQRYYIVIIRNIFLKGVGINVLWDEMLALLVIGVFVITMSSLRFQKRLG